MVTPVYKAKDRTSLSNYRKKIGQHMFSRVLNFINKYEILAANQYDFLVHAYVPAREHVCASGIISLIGAQLLPAVLDPLSLNIA